MQKKFEVLMICCLFVSSFLLARAGAAFVSAKSTTDSPKCIVLDAGHGGSDPGKVGCGDVLEKDINLAIVYKLKTLFENKGFKVVLTRTDDKPLAAENSKNMKIEDMRNRVALITETMPVMTISIHQNSYQDSAVYGPQVFYYADSENGRNLALAIQEELNRQLSVARPREAKGNRTYYLLKRSPSVINIVECGFLTNPEEAQLLKKEEYQTKIAMSVADGIDTYLASQEEHEKN